MRVIIAVFMAVSILVLGGCNISKLAEKIRPDEAARIDAQNIEALKAKDKAYFIDKFSGIYSDPDALDAALDQMFAYVPDGEEKSRLLVGANMESSFNVDTKTGRTSSKSWDTSYELQIGDKYMSVNNIYGPKPDGTCCVLTGVNIDSYDTPVLATQLKTMQRAGTIALVVFICVLLGLIALVVFLIRRSRAKKRAAQG